MLSSLNSSARLLGVARALGPLTGGFLGFFGAAALLLVLKGSGPPTEPLGHAFGFWNTAVLFPLGVILGAWWTEKRVGSLAAILITGLHVYALVDYVLHESQKIAGYAQEVERAVFAGSVAVALLVTGLSLVARWLERRSR